MSAVAFALVLSLAGLQARVAPQASAELLFVPNYQLVGADGGVFAFGGAHFSGGLGGQPIGHKIVAVLNASANAIDGPGYLLVDSAGIVYPFGLKSYGDLRGVRLRSPIVGAVAVGAPDGSKGGYLLVAADGGVFAFGAAHFPGSLAAFHLPAPIVGMALSLNPGTAPGAPPDPDPFSYRLADTAGRVYTLGRAPFHGDLTHAPSISPVVGILADTDGYLLATANGRVIPFGIASEGDISHLHLSAPISGIALAGIGGGYVLFASDGGVFTFGAGRFLGSMAGRHLNAPITAMTSQLLSRNTCAARAKAPGNISITPMEPQICNLTWTHASPALAGASAEPGARPSQSTRPRA